MRALRDWVRDFDGFFPDAPLHDGFWYVKVPIDEGLVDGPHSKHSVRRFVIDALLVATQALRQAKAETNPDARAVTLIVLPDLFSSSIDVFFDNDAFASFTTRPGRNQEWMGQSWIPLPSNRSLLKEWQLAHDMQEIGYRTTWTDEDCTYEGEIWLIGDVQ